MRCWSIRLDLTGCSRWGMEITTFKYKWKALWIPKTDPWDLRVSYWDQVFFNLSLLFLICKATASAWLLDVADASLYLQDFENCSLVCKMLNFPIKHWLIHLLLLPHSYLVTHFEDLFLRWIQFDFHPMKLISQAFLPQFSFVSTPRCGAQQTAVSAETRQAGELCSPFMRLIFSSGVQWKREETTYNRGNIRLN